MHFGYFEAVILNKDIENDKKHIKLLELSLQHGEDSKVDYDPIDKLVGIYNDIEENKLVSISEYVQSTNENIKDVEKKLQEARLMVEFLAFIKAPKQYHIARKMDIDGPLIEMLAILNKTSEEERDDLKLCLFSMLLAKPEGDITRHIREVKKLVGTEFLPGFIEDQKENSIALYEMLPSEEPTTIEIINDEIRSNDEIKSKMADTLDKYIYRNRISISRNKPLDLINRSIESLNSIDTDFFPNMKDSDLSKVADSLDSLLELVSQLKDKLNVPKC